MGLEKEEFPLGDGKNAAAFVSRIIGRKFLENFAQISGALSTRSRSHSCPNELLLLFASLADYIAGWLAQLSPIVSRHRDALRAVSTKRQIFDRTRNLIFLSSSSHDLPKLVYAYTAVLHFPIRLSIFPTPNSC